MSVQEHILGTQHIGIPTNDSDKTAAFFKSLGFKEAYKTDNHGELVRFFKLGTVCIETYQNNKAAMAPGAVDHIALDVDDIEAAYKAVKALGYSELEDGIQFLPFWEHGVRYFTIMGPDKEKIEFSQMLKN